MSTSTLVTLYDSGILKPERWVGVGGVEFILSGTLYYCEPKCIYLVMQIQRLRSSTFDAAVRIIFLILVSVVAAISIISETHYPDLSRRTASSVYRTEHASMSVYLAKRIRWHPSVREDPGSIPGEGGLFPASHPSGVGKMRSICCACCSWTSAIVAPVVAHYSVNYR